MAADASDTSFANTGAFGVNYALRPHKFVDRRIFMEVLSKFSGFDTIDDHVYVGLGSFALEDHKLMHASFGLRTLISLEIDDDVFARQKFNAPLACIKPTPYSTNDFVVRRSVIFRETGVSEDASAIIWFDLTDAETIRAHLDSFRQLLQNSQRHDVIRMTVDVDEKTLGRGGADETLNEISIKRFERLRELLGDELQPGARVRSISPKLGLTKLVVYAFRLVAEKAFERDRVYKFEPFSLTTYADGHRMLSVTGAIIERVNATACRDRMGLRKIPGGVNGWDELVDVQLPQLTVWEKLRIDRDINDKTLKQLGKIINFKLHETISTTELLEAYSVFQRFYPTFRHVLL
jgi:putative O-methyltransferase